MRKAGRGASDLGEGLLRLQLLRDQPLLALSSLAYLIALSVYGFVVGSASALPYLVLMSLVMLFVAVVYRRVRFSSGVLWGLELWGSALSTKCSSSESPE